ncbi:MAG TPA: aminoglycoside phosphotransferase family protein, partial [Lachnospiraceae bacterium]|nr:aminoglycoside phosphotransferase family protein [Lachnospiraceae bacterium]
EYQNGMIIQNILKCVPKVYGMAEIDDRSGIIYEEIHGTDMLKIMAGVPWKINAYAKELAHDHLSIQKPVSSDLWTVKEKLEENLQNAKMLSNENKELVLKYLKQLPDGNELCHFDFHPGNVMIADGRPVILDWMTACRGNACADVARTCLLLKYGEAVNVPWITRKMISFFQHHIYKIYIKEYLAISLKSRKDIDSWELPVAAARLCEWVSENEKKKLLWLVDGHCKKIRRG